MPVLQGFVFFRNNGDGPGSFYNHATLFVFKQNLFSVCLYTKLNVRSRCLPNKIVLVRVTGHYALFFNGQIFASCTFLLFNVYVGDRGALHFILIHMA